MDTTLTLGNRLRRARYRAMLTECVECYERWNERFDLAEFCTATSIDIELMHEVSNEHDLEIVESYVCTKTYCPCDGKGTRLKIKATDRQPPP